MEMRKFIIEVHPDGTLTCCEYEDPKESIRAATDRAWPGIGKHSSIATSRLTRLRVSKALANHPSFCTRGANPFAMWCHRPIVNTLTQKK